MGVIAWLRDNQDTGILYRSDGNPIPIAYYDAAHNQYSSDRKAHHGSSIHLFGGPISVDSKKHDDTGDSTPYNEYMALFHCARRVMWVRNIIREVNYFNENLLFYMIREATVLYGDNDTATSRARERKTTMNDRHSALKYHTIREWVEKGELATDRVATADNHRVLPISTPDCDSSISGIVQYAPLIELSQRALSHYVLKFQNSFDNGIPYMVPDC